MTNLQFDKEITALLVIDPYNDFISEGGKLWDRIKTVAEANKMCIRDRLIASPHWPRPHFWQDQRADLPFLVGE